MSNRTAAQQDTIGALGLTDVQTADPLGEHPAIIGYWSERGIDIVVLADGSLSYEEDVA